MPTRALLVAIALWHAPAAAQPDDEDRARAKAAFQAGTTAYDLGRFKEALRHYEEAYRRDPQPAILFNLAQCHRHLGQWERAAFFYRRYLSQGAPQGDARTLAEKLLAEVNAKEAEEKARKRAKAERERARATAQKAQGDAPTQESSPPLAEAPVLVDPLGEIAPPAAFSPAPAAVQDPQQEVALTRKWWFWTAVGAVALGAAGAGVWVATAPNPSPTTLGTRDLR